MKALLIVLDGVGDRPLKELQGKTPLEAATTPNMDKMAEKGICGILDPIAPGVRPGSDTSHLAILGYNPFEVYTGRGPFEAAGVGIGVREGDVAFRCNFATVDDNLIVKDRRAGRIGKGTKELAEAINKIKIPGVKIIFKESLRHRAALVLRGDGLSHKVSDSDPKLVGKKVKRIEALEESLEAKRTAEILNEFMAETQKVMGNHEINAKRSREGKAPANILLIRGAGKVPSILPFKEKYGIEGGCIATVGLVRGICKLCGLEVLGIRGGESVKELGKMALDQLENYDFLILNIKTPDDAGHDKDASRKVRVIEEVDATISKFSSFIGENYLVILGDHTTPCSIGEHTGDPVPITICGPEVRTDEVSKFNERSVAKGGLGRIKGQDVMNILIDLMDKSEKFGA